MTTTGEKDLNDKAEDLFFKLKCHFNHMKEELSGQRISFNNSSEIPTLLSLCFKNETSMITIPNQDIKEIKKKNLQAAEVCLKIILIYLESSHTFEVKKSILHTSLQSLYEAYSHCRDSETYYGEIFEEFTNELGNFYKLIQELQKAALKCLDDLINANSYDEDSDSAEITLISRDIGKLGELVSSLDRMFSIVFWKTFIKLIFKFKDIAQKKIQVDSYLVALISDIKDIVFHCKYCIETKEQIEDSEVKVGVIELTALKKIIDVFQGGLKQDTIIQMQDLALQLYNLLIITCSVAEMKDLNIVKILLRAAKPVIAYFFFDNRFFTSAFHCTTNDVSTDLQLPLVLLKLTALDYLKTFSDPSLLSQTKALKILFETLKTNRPEDDLKLVTLKVQESLSRDTLRESSELISLFDYCYASLTEYCRHMRSNNVTECCENWLSSYTSCSDIVSLLISDVWIYYIRCGSVEDVYKNSKVLSKALEQSNSKTRIELLLIRMLQFLPTSHKITLFEEEKYLSHMLCNKDFVPRFGSSPISFMPNNLKSSEKIKMILTNLGAQTSSSIQMSSEKACDILEVGALSIDKLTASDLLKILKFANIYLKSNDFRIQMSTLSLLRTFNGRILSKNSKELDALTSVIAELFCELMNCKNIVIKLEALGVYFNLAQSTTHTEMIKKVVIKCPSLTPFIKSYAEKVPPKGFLKEETKQMCFKKQLFNYQKCCITNTSEDSFSSTLFP